MLQGKAQGSDLSLSTKLDPSDPILTLVPINNTGENNVTSLCFLNYKNKEIFTNIDNDVNTKGSNSVVNNNSDSDLSVDDDDDSDSSIQFRCGSLLRHQRKSHNQPSSSTLDTTLDLQGRYLVTCYSNGECHIWDLYKRAIVESVSSPRDRRGPGLAVRSLHESNSHPHDSRFFFQTRDEEGTITLHDWGHTKNVATIKSLQCKSETFCCAAPCQGNANLIVLPCNERSYAMIRDWRMPSSHHPIACFHGGCGFDAEALFECMETGEYKKYGMVTSLAMIESDVGTIIACGMENGSIVYHDLSMLQKCKGENFQYSYEPCQISLGSDPVLSLDMTSSTGPFRNISYITVAGLAGNEEDIAELPQCERGRLAVLKTSYFKDNTNGSPLQVRMRSRISTLEKSASQFVTSINRKPGIGVCRFRPDGRIFAVGGWDKRIRIYDRRNSDTVKPPIALLRGHQDSVNAIDWSFDAEATGLIATGSSDGRVHVWSCFGQKM